jgi:hypothetical protein
LGVKGPSGRDRGTQVERETVADALRKRGEIEHAVDVSRADAIAVDVALGAPHEHVALDAAGATSNS